VINFQRGSDLKFFLALGSEEKKNSRNTEMQCGWDNFLMTKDALE